MMIMNTTWMKRLLMMMGIAYTGYAICQAVGLYELYDLVMLIYAGARGIVIRAIVVLVIQSVLIMILLWGLWKQVKWFRYVLYSLTVLFIAYGVTFLPMSYQTYINFSLWFQGALVFLIISYIAMIVLSCLYLLSARRLGNEEYHG